MKLSAKKTIAQLLLIAAGATLLAVVPLPSVTLLPELGVDREALALEPAPLPEDGVLDNPFAHDDASIAPTTAAPAETAAGHPDEPASGETAGDRLQGGATDVDVGVRTQPLLE